MASPDLNRVKAIFAEALPLGGTERQAFLDRACAGDAELRAEVEAYLLATEREGVILGTSISEMATFHTPLVQRPGSKIGRYKLLEQIGAGGFGVVFMAEQEQPVRRRVALKIIKLGMDTKQVVARFEAERQALAMMDHPNIAKVFDAGSTDTGRPYFVMELVKGIPITRYCDEHHLTPRDRLELFVRVCSAVQHAHTKGIIHRDLKPSNVLVALYDGKPVPKVIDFGIAKATGQPLTERTLFTGFGSVVGTPEYMSPEQAELNQLDVDTRSDIYSLGVLLYELLTGSTPLEHNRFKAAALLEMLRVVREEEPPKPSTRLSTTAGLPSIAANRGLEPKKLSALVHGELDWIVMKSLEKDRSRRYETANGFATDVQRYLDDDAVQACPASAVYRLKKFVRRHKVGVLAGAAIAAALVAGLILASIGFIQANRERAIARAEAARSEQVAQFLKDMLEGVGPSVALGRDTTVLREILDKTAGRLAQDLKQQPEAEIELRTTLAEIYFQLGLYNQAEEMARENVRLSRAHFGEESASTAKALQQQAAALRRLRANVEAEKLIREALAIQRKLYGNEHQEIADSLVILGFTLLSQYGPAAAESSFREGLAMQRRLAGNENVKVAIFAGNLSENLRYEGKLPEAESLAREELAILRKLFGNEHPYVADALGDLASVLGDQDRLAEAEITRREALAMRRKFLGNEHPNVAYSLAQLAVVLERQGKLAEAENSAREALAVQRKASGNGHPDVALYLEYLASAIQQQGRLTEAEPLLREALDIRRKALPAGGRGAVSEDVETLAELLQKQGKLTEAERLYRELLEMRRKAVEETPRDALALDNLAWMLATSPVEQFRDPTQAVELAKEAVQINPADDKNWNTLGVAEYRAGNWPAAIHALNKSMEMRKGGNGFDWFFVAMASYQLDNRDEARKWYDQAVAEMDRNKPQSEELRRFRREAEQLLKITDTKPTTKSESK